MNSLDDARGRTLAVRAPAKVNLALRVTAREESGYHQLETVFCALELADEIEVRPAGDALRLEVEGAELGPAEDNLVHRAAVAYFRATGRPARAELRLRKRIPAGAGLGGGSSDAASTLLALNALDGGPLDAAVLLDIGARLGSDVAFFLCGSPLALAWGRGERLLPLPALPPAPVLIAIPDFGIATPDAYRQLAEHRTRNGGRRRGGACLTLDDLGAWPAVARLAGNDFEAPTYARYAELGAWRDVMRDAGARIALLAGSGAAVFGVFDDDSTRAAAATALAHAESAPRLIESRTAASVPRPGVESSPIAG